MRLRSLVQTLFNVLNPRSHSAVDTGSMLMISKNALYSTVVAPVFALRKAIAVFNGFRLKESATSSIPPCPHRPEVTNMRPAKEFPAAREHFGETSTFKHFFPPSNLCDAIPKAEPLI